MQICKKNTIFTIKDHNMMYRFSKFIFTSLLLVFSAHVQAQPEVENYPRRATYDTAYIQTYVDQLIIRGLGIKKSNRLNLQNGKSEKVLSYRPNENLNLGFGFNYKFVGLNLAFDLPFINNDDNKYGHTSIFDLQLTVFAPTFGLNTYYQTYKGFYIDDPQKGNPNWTEKMAYPQRPDLRTVNAGAEFYYIFNHKRFSQRATFVQNERQKRSAGSWLAGSYLNLFSAKADSSFLPKHLHHTIERNQDAQNVTLWHGGISGGYIHTFVIKKYFYITLSAELGIGLQDRRYLGRKGLLTEEWGLGNKFKSRLGFGYNGQKYFAGISSIMDNVRLTTEKNTSLESSLMQFKFFMGRRLDFDHRKVAKNIFKKQQKL